MTRLFKHIKKAEGIVLALLLLSVLAGIVGCSADPVDNDPPETPGLWGVWVQAFSITTPEKVDKLLARIQAGHFNAILVNVFASGRAYYESTLLEKHPDLAADYDPLAYIIEQAHARDIEVHTWLVAGPVGGGKWGPSPILAQHPNWAMISLDGETSSWLNYNRPDVRQFIGDMALEIVENYAVDGIHFDYLRYPYPGWKWGFDDYSAQVFAQEYGFELAELRYATLPAYGTFSGNTLAGVNTAQVLAVFDNGQPAIVLNHYGEGEAILFNWEADERRVAASSEILGRSIKHLLGKGGQVYIFRVKPGSGDFENTITWLKDIGQTPLEITEDELAELGAQDVLVMPSVYDIAAQVASQLADFVQQGGGIIFIDGPTRAIEDNNIQAITGMRRRGGYFERAGLIIPIGSHDLIPTSSQELELHDYQLRDVQWKTFRQQNITQVLQEVYQRVKNENPDVLVTITISANQETLAEIHFLDWQTWLENEYTDLLIPRAYVREDEPLMPLIAGWQTIMQQTNRIMLGLISYTPQNNEQVSKTPARMLSEIELIQANGSNGLALFDIEHIDDTLLDALAAGPLSPANQ